MADTVNVAPIRTPMVDDSGNLTPPWQRYFSGQDQFVSSVIGGGDGGDGGGAEPPGNPANVHQTVANRSDGYYTITATWETPVPIGNTSKYEAQFRFYTDPTCATPETPWQGSNVVIGGDTTTLTTDAWPQVGGPRWVRTRVRGLSPEDAFSIWVESPVGTGALINPKPGDTGGVLPDNCSIISGDWEYTDTNTLKIRIFYTPGANSIGVHCWEEREDQSTTGGAPMDGSVPMDGTKNLGGEFAPIDRGYFAKSPLVLYLDKPPAPVIKRFYLASFSPDMERALVRATDPTPTPSIKIPVGTPTYQSGVEYARLITGPTVAVEYDDTQISSAKYRFRFTWVAPTDPPTPWQNDFGGCQIVYEYPDGTRANGPAFAVNETTGRSDWYDVHVTAPGGDPVRCWFVSYDNSETPRLNKIIEGVTPVSTALIIWPLTGRDPAAPYTDNVTNFDVKNLRFDYNDDGQKVLKMDATWTQPAAGAPRARWGGVVIWLHDGQNNKFQVSGPEIGMGLTMQFSGWPSADETWKFFGVSQDNNANPNTDGRSPIAGTPTDSIVVGPPAKVPGREFTSNVTIGVGQGFSVAAVAVSDGTTQQRITSMFTPPADKTWGGVEMRVYDDTGKLLGITVGSVSPLTFTLPNPATASGTMTATVKLVSFDVNNKTNTEQAITPQGTVSIGNPFGTFDVRKWLSTSTDLYTIVNGKLTIASEQIYANMIRAGEITSDKLNVIEVKVGGSTGAADKPAKFGVYNSSGVQIGFIGVEAGNQGAWFKTLAIGSTSYSNAPIKVDNAGVVKMEFPRIGDSTNNLLISQADFVDVNNPTYGHYYSTGIRITSGNSPTTGSDTTWFVSRGLVIYGTALPYGAVNYQVASINRDPSNGASGEVVVIGPGSASYVRLGGFDGTVRADGGYTVAGNKVVGSRVVGWGTPSGFYDRSSFNNNDVMTVNQLAARVGAIIFDLRTHGLLGS